MKASAMAFPPALQPEQVTLLGYGALLSESSSRLTFPELKNFRHVRVKGWRRVFAHPHLFFVQENLLDPLQTLKLATLSAEPAPTTDASSFVVAAFDVKLDEEQRRNFLKREPEYQIVTTPYYALGDEDHSEQEEPIGEGVICVASQDVNLPDSLEVPASIQELGGVWHWSHDSGLLPAGMYLRHCLLAVQKVGGRAYESFLHDTYLADRRTTLASYLEEHGEEVMASHPPPYLATRFGG